MSATHTYCALEMGQISDYDIRPISTVHVFPATALSPLRQCLKQVDTCIWVTKRTTHYLNNHPLLEHVMQVDSRTVQIHTIIIIIINIIIIIIITQTSTQHTFESDASLTILFHVIMEQLNSCHLDPYQYTLAKQ